MKISVEDSKTLKEHLPSNHVEAIRTKLLDKGITISGRWILKVLSGEGDDNYGIIEIATDMALKEKNRLEKVKNQIGKLNKK